MADEEAKSPPQEEKNQLQTETENQQSAETAAENQQSAETAAEPNTDGTAAEGGGGKEGPEGEVVGTGTESGDNKEMGTEQETKDASPSNDAEKAPESEQQTAEGDQQTGKESASKPMEEEQVQDTAAVDDGKEVTKDEEKIIGNVQVGEEENGDKPDQEMKEVDESDATAAKAATDDNQGEEPMVTDGEVANVTTTAENAMVTDETGEKHEVDPHASSPQPVLPANATATVKFVLMPSGHVSTMACALSQTVHNLRDHFAGELRMPADKLVFMFDGSSIKDDMSLLDLGVGPNGAVQLEISSADPISAPIKPPKPKPEYVMPDVITVRVERENGTMESIVVEIERSNRRKPFLGGYKHRLTSVEYHHAAAQTRPKMRAESGIEKFCRDTQTVNTKNQRQQTKIETSTQMTTIGCYVANMTDRLVVPGKYTTASEHHAMILSKVIILQSYFRRWQAKRHVAKLKVDLAKRMEWERQEEIRKIKEKEDRIKKEFERRMNPRTKEDFDLLYHALEKWRQEELETINASLSGPKRKAALCHLLDQETQLIASIGRHKLEADTENKQRAIQKFLDKAASPKRWRSYDGKYIEMDTAYTTRARELRDIYNSLNMKYLTQDERLDVLLTLKHTVKEHDCKLTQEIIELIDREADLLMRGVKESNLEGLRKRISTLFLQYVKTPTFNAEAARLIKVPQDPSSLRKNIHYCQSCNSYLPSTEFQLSSNSKLVGRCRRCTKLDNDARTRQDFSHFRFMLRSLRKSEENMQDGSRIAFLLQEDDLRYLVENIWATQSALSAWTDLYDLVLVRWDKDEEWSPWNCILLTKDEAQAHARIEDIEKGYGRVFCHKIKTKHTLARNYFSRLPGMAEHIRTQANQPKPGNSIATKSVAVTKA
ncbi:IQ motif and ubiquitin-like domain-containing protein [Amphiura filiformis]|uniref:IQ motif and ubiquitin-like domain-containing protein n=1 Tax=Amphiura filiformis TaxID=82378 RepID=UPI003B20C31C